MQGSQSGLSAWPATGKGSVGQSTAQTVAIGEACSSGEVGTQVRRVTASLLASVLPDYHFLAAFCERGCLGVN